MRTVAQCLLIKFYPSAVILLALGLVAANRFNRGGNYYESLNEWRDRMSSDTQKFVAEEAYRRTDGQMVEIP